jgi:hypothetical protein
MIDLQEMRWSSAAQMASTLPVDFMVEKRWSCFVIWQNPIMHPSARSGSNKTLHYEKSGKLTLKNRHARRYRHVIRVGLKNYQQT